MMVSVFTYSVILVILYILHGSFILNMFEPIHGKKLRFRIILLTVILASVVSILFLLIYNDDYKSKMKALFFATVIIFFIAAFFTSQGSAVKKTFIYISYVNMFVSVYIIVTMITALLLKEDVLLNLVYLDIAFALILYIYVRFIKKKFIKAFREIQEGWNKFLILSLLFFVKFIYDMIFSISKIFIEFSFLQTWNMLLEVAIMVFVYVVIFSNINYNLEIVKMKQVVLQNDFLVKQAKDNEYKIEQSRRTRHDFRHHNVVIVEFAKNKDCEGLLEYLKAYEESLDKQVVEVICPNGIVNSVLIGYKNKAQEHNISVNMDVRIPREIYINEVDIVSILANAMENALQSCLRSEKDEKEISLRIYLKSDKMIISIINTCSDDVEILKGKPNLKHGSGIGVSSIISSADNYFGNVDFSYKDSMFSCNIILNHFKHNQIITKK